MAAPPDLHQLVRQPDPLPQQEERVLLILRGSTYIVGAAACPEYADWFERGWHARLDLRSFFAPASIQRSLAGQWERGWRRANTYADQCGLNDIPPFEAKHVQPA